MKTVHICFAGISTKQRAMVILLTGPIAMRSFSVGLPLCGNFFEPRTAELENGIGIAAAI